MTPRDGASAVEKRPIASARTASLREAAKRDVFTGGGSAPELRKPPAREGRLPGAGIPQPRYRAPAPAAPMPSTIVNAQGLSALTTDAGPLPPDTSGDVGLTQYVQMTNTRMAVYDKETGAQIEGTEIFLATMWNALASHPNALCDEQSSGDPVVLYDQLADRWLVSQFAFISFAEPYDYRQCIAVSETADATGAWNAYEYVWSAHFLNDYPHFAVWPDGYHMTVNEFDDRTGWFQGVAVAVFDREAMLAGEASPLVQTVAFAYEDWGITNLLAADLDGGSAPPPGSPAYFTMMDDLRDEVHLFAYVVDWEQPSNTGFYFIDSLEVAPFSTLFCDGYLTPCIPQPGTLTKLDQLADRAMFRLAYRNFGSHESIVMNHTIQMLDGSTADQAGIRWYEIRNPLAPTLHQSGTYAPDGDNRWMGSIAQDAHGNLALGYSVSSSTTNPSIRYAGRLAGDPLGTLPQTEVTLQAGGGVQAGDSGRWGDYSQMAVDPEDECTFWYTNEYYDTTTDTGWTTRFASFKYPSCVTGRVTGTVIDKITGAPVANATIKLGSYIARTDAAGAYQLRGIPTGTYPLVASSDGYARTAAVNQTIGTPATRNFALTRLAASDVNGDGFEDVVTGVPGEDIGSIADAGAVQVIFGGPAGPAAPGDELIHQHVAGADDWSEKGDRFGAAVTTGDFNGDGFSDIAVGVPLEDVGRVVNAGAVHVFLGSASGIINSTPAIARADKVITQNSANIADVSEAEDRFGSSVAAGDFNNDGYSDLAIGVPYEDITVSGKAKGNAGAVSVVYGSSNGLTTSNQFWNQNTAFGGAAVQDAIEPSDHFGWSLAAGDVDGDGFEDLAIGVPYEDGSTTLVNSGATHVIFGSRNKLVAVRNQLWNQDSRNIQGVRAKDDRFGFSVAIGDLNGDGYGDLVSGIPYENSGGDNDSGAVSIIYGRVTGLVSTGNQLWHQDSGSGAAAMGESTNPGDRFGAAVATGDLTGDGIDDLAIGVPGEDLSSRVDVGGVALLKGSANGATSSGNRFIAQNGVSPATTLTSNSAEASDVFGSAVAIRHVKGGLFAALIVGVPGEDLSPDANPGLLHVVFGASTLVTTTGNQAWSQDSVGGGTAIDDLTEPHDQLGAALA